MVWYAEKEEKPFLFSPLGQMIQFGTIKFRRTFKNYSGQFVWIKKEKKESPKRRLEKNKKQGSKTIRSTSFAWMFWTHQIIDVDIILSFTSTAS